VRTNISMDCTGRCRTDYDLEVAIRTCILKSHFVALGMRVSERSRRFTFPELLNETADDLQARHSQNLTQTDRTGLNRRSVLSVPGTDVRPFARVRCCTLIEHWFHWSKSQLALWIFLEPRRPFLNFLGQARRFKLRCGWLPVNGCLGTLTD
jgi:hypothetical protein